MPRAKTGPAIHQKGGTKNIPLDIQSATPYDTPKPPDKGLTVENQPSFGDSALDAGGPVGCLNTHADGVANVAPILRGLSDSTTPQRGKGPQAKRPAAPRKKRAARTPRATRTVRQRNAWLAKMMRMHPMMPYLYGERLLMLRVRNYTAPNTVATALGMNPLEYRRHEKYATRPAHPAELERLTEALDLSPAEFDWLADGSLQAPPFATDVAAEDDVEAA